MIFSVHRAGKKVAEIEANEWSHAALEAWAKIGSDCLVMAGNAEPPPPDVSPQPEPVTTGRP